MSKSFACRPPPERDGIWMKDRFYPTPPDDHYQSTAGALFADRTDAAPDRPLPRKFELMETLRSEHLRFPFTMHDNRYQHETLGESLRGTHRKARPCCIRREHSESEPDAFIDTAGRPTSEQRLQTIARETFRVPVDGTAARARRFPHEQRCPFKDGSCEHRPVAQRRCEPASTGPPAAAEA
ncbi:hypothetical protein FJT64_002778 [Amphibalanus amphitrite]|uniref:Domain of unknown function with conserved HDNR motif domain-containing protein n=1 Tax=Amphibalanus amphitrite TaxID=1232801 RepID=A0A6A4W961_AMPAM|nr:hypothetical protein FJT64_002778 [Amphibalanus amphitrite]